MSRAYQGQTILFLCTGNYYRSRFAEYFFNHLATHNSLDWRADSRGLALERGQNNVEAISKYARRGLEDLNIQLPDNLRYPLPLTLRDLQAVHRVIAVDESEHRLLMQSRFPEWEHQIEYWLVHDLDRSTMDVALKQLEAHIQRLVAEL